MLDDIRNLCLSKPLVTEELPFGPENLVFKVAGKMFLIVSLDAVPLQFNAKNTPEKNEELRERYSNILPGYHMNKTHWNTIIIDDGINWKLVTSLINDSYNLVENSVSKKVKDSFKK